MDDDCPITETPTVPLNELTEPALVMDSSGRVLLWYLPNAISSPNQVSPNIFQSLQRANGSLETHVGAAGNVERASAQQPFCWRSLKLVNSPQILSDGS